MNPDDFFSPLRDFFTSESACQQALRHLKAGVEIRVRLPDGRECALFHEGGPVRFEERPARRPDVEFQIREDLSSRLSQWRGSSPGALGVAIVREIAARRIEVRICGSYFNVLKDGYMKIILEAGPELSRFLSQHGLSSATKIASLIRRLKA